MIAEKLKKSILQAAIQGKLTKHEPGDGTAAELLQQIAAEKAKLIKEGKIKKEKPLPEISEEEKPFDLPEGWEWCRLGDIIHIESGDGLTKRDMLGGTVPVFGGNGVTGYFTKANVYEKTLVIGRVGFYCGSIHITPKVAWVTDNAFITFFSKKYIDMDFLAFLFQALQLGKQSHATAQPVVSGKLIYPMVVAVPPLAEQHRIVARVEKLLSQVDSLSKDEKKLDALQSTMPERLKASLLQAAIQGKLTERLPGDGNAEDLLTEIAAEKQRLIKEKKIKKEKPLPEIREEEKPFDLPEGWIWCRLGEIFTLQAGKNISASYIKETGEYPCYGGNGIRGYVDKYNTIGDFPIIGRQGALCGNVNIASGKFYATEHAVVVYTYAQCLSYWALYFLTALNLNQYATATAQPGLAVNKINMVYIPLPPLAEQQRIVQRLEELLPLCEGIMHE